MYKKDKKCEQEFLKNFGKNLKVIIKSSGMTQKQFSEELGVSQDTITNWIQGNTFPQPLLLKNVIVYCLGNPQIKTFDIYNLFLYDTNLSEIENNLIKLKKEYLDSKGNNEKIQELNKTINYLKIKADSLEKENKKLTEENEIYKKEYEYISEEYEELDENIVNELETCKKQIKNEVLNEKFRDLTNKCYYHIQSLSRNFLISCNTKLSEELGQCSVEKSESHEELLKKYIKLFSKEISIDLRNFVNKDIEDIIKNM